MYYKPFSSAYCDKLVGSPVLWVLQFMKDMCFDELTGEDVSENKDEGVIRRQLVKGDGFVTPRDGASCEGL